MTEQPLLIVVAGPNGSGKSTLTASGLAGDAPVIDPDAIARSMNPDNPAAAAVSAGKEALSQQQDAIENKQTFAVETTLSGNGPLRLMEQAQEAGYEVQLHYVRVGTPEANIDRISQRVADGGHFVPDEDVARRYERSMENLPTAISLSDSSTLYDNSGEVAEPVAELSRESFQFFENAPRWAVRAGYEGAKEYYAQAETDTEYRDAALRQAEATVAAGALSEDELERLKQDLLTDPAPDLDNDHGL